jgi:hypothetical protein
MGNEFMLFQIMCIGTPPLTRNAPELYLWRSRLESGSLK